MSRQGRIGGKLRIRRTFARASGSTVTDAAQLEAEAEREARHWQATAPKLGFCGHCGENVDEANGKLHAHDCPYLPAERRRAS
jgi:hypothetical protein